MAAAKNPPTPTPRRRKHRNRQPSEDVAKLARAVKALYLRTRGASYRQIGAQLDVLVKTADLDVQVELGQLDAVVKAKAERLRDLEALRLDSKAAPIAVLCTPVVELIAL